MPRVVHDTKTFIEKANMLHKQKYDYSLVNYINTSSKVKIICNDHGVFEQSPIKHTSNKNPTGCPRCANKYQTTQDFIKKATAVHGNTYDYSKSVYVNDTTKLIITCKIHGDFTQMPSNHHSLKQGCKACGQANNKPMMGAYNLSMFRLYENLREIPAKLYYIKLSKDGEVFYKVGITTQKYVKRRLNQMSDYVVTLMETRSGRLYDMWKLEQLILGGSGSHTPKQYFKGYGECLSSPLPQSLEEFIIPEY